MPILLDDETSVKLFEHLDNPDENQEEYARLMKMPSESMAGIVSWQAPKDCELLKIYNSSYGDELIAEFTVLDHASKRVLYFNRVVKSEIVIPRDGKPVTQVLIWRKRSQTQRTHGVVQSIFFEYLLPNYNIVISDNEQTRNGQRMWLDLLEGAIERAGLCAASFNTNTGIVDSINNEKELYERSVWLWGDNEIHQERLAVIASKKD